MRVSARKKSTKTQDPSKQFWRMLEKAAKAADAKTQEARNNYFIDLLHEAKIIDKQRDRQLHFANEMTHGKGDATTRLGRWSKKARKYKR